MKDALPEKTRRLFPHYRAVDPLDPGFCGMFLAKLMEEGNSRDLSWLTRTFPEARLAEWFDRYGSRQLSRRSRCFWQRILDRTDRHRSDPGVDLWPL